MTKLEFPTVPHDVAVECFNCHLKTNLKTILPTGFSEGRGSRMAKCDACGMWTSFDIKSPKGETR